MWISEELKTIVLITSGVQPISPSSWYETVEFLLFVLLNWSISYIPYFTISYTAYVFDYHLVFCQVQSANFALMPALEYSAQYPGSFWEVFIHLLYSRVPCLLRILHTNRDLEVVALARAVFFFVPVKSVKVSWGNSHICHRSWSDLHLRNNQIIG
jgi:hypothetical protein